MNNDTQTDTLKRLTEQLLEGDESYFLVDIRVKPGNHIKVYLDGDQGIPIDKCVSINRQLYKAISEHALFPGDDFSLEVSSPGLDEPLKLHRQYRKNTGRKVEVVTQEGKVLEGLMKEVDADRILLVEEKGKNKKKELVEHSIPFEQIKTTKIQIVF